MQRLRILCVDDNVELGKLLVHLLDLAGHTAMHAADGAEAWARFGEALIPYDLVLTDHDMPQLNGLAFVSRLRSGGYDGRIIVHTSGLRPETRDRYHALGVERIIPKCISTEELLEVVRTVDTSGAKR